MCFAMMLVRTVQTARTPQLQDLYCPPWLILHLHLAAHVTLAQTEEETKRVT